MHFNLNWVPFWDKKRNSIHPFNISKNAKWNEWNTFWSSKGQFSECSNTATATATDQSENTWIATSRFVWNISKGTIESVWNVIGKSMSVSYLIVTEAKFSKMLHTKTDEKLKLGLIDWNCSPLSILHWNAHKMSHSEFGVVNKSRMTKITNGLCSQAKIFAIAVAIMYIIWSNDK